MEGTWQHKVEQLLEEKFQEEDYLDFFLVEMVFNPTGKQLTIFIDSDTSINLNQCSRINRYLQGHIDENGWLGEVYTLDVSSPGTRKPLKFHRQYVKNVGRKVKVKQIEGSEEQGTLIVVEEDHIILEEKRRIKEGKKKKNVLVKTTIPFDNIKETVVQISFK